MKRKLSKAVKTSLSLLSIMILLPGMLACKTDASKTGSGTGGKNGKAPIGNAVQGAFIEKEVTPEGIAYIQKPPTLMDDGSLVFYGKKDRGGDDVCRFTSVDGGNIWTKEELDWRKQTGDVIDNIAPYPDGSCFFESYMLDDEDEIKDIKWWLADKTGALTEIPVPEWAEGKYLSTCEMMTNDVLFLGGAGRNDTDDFYKVYNIATKETYDVDYPFSVSGGYVSGIVLNRSNPADPELYFADFSGSTVTLSAISLKGEVRQVQDNLSGSLSGAVDPEGNYYYSDSGNIIRIAKNGGLKEMIVENDNFLLGMDQYYCAGMTYVSENCFLAALNNLSGGDMLVRYYYDENVTLTKTDRLTIWSLYENDTMRQAARNLGNDHPELEINVIVGVDDTTETEEEDAIRSLRASLLTDECPDLILLDGLDYMSMAKKGYFIDLAKSVDTSELLSNIISPLYLNGELPVIPARFSAPVLIGDDLGTHPVNSLSDLKKEILERPGRDYVEVGSEEYYRQLGEAERYGLGFKSMEEMVRFILKTSASEIIKDGSIDDGALEEVFDFITAVGAHYGMKDYPDTDNDFVFAVVGSSDNMDMVESGTGECEYSLTNRAQYGWGELKTPAYFAECRRSKRYEDTKGTLISFPGLSEKPFIPTCVVGIPVKAKNQEMAVEMIRRMISKSIQLNQDSVGNPVNQEALADKINQHKEFVEEQGFVGDMEAFYQELKTPVLLGTQTSKLEELMIAEALEVCAGKKTKEQAIKSIKEDTYLMFEEQK